MKKRGWVILGILGILLLAGVATYAAYGLGVPCHVKVVQAPPPQPQVQLAFYENEQCFIPCTFVEWGTMEQGEQKTKNPVFYVKNTGAVPAIIANGTSINFGQVSLWFWQHPGWESTRALNIGESCKVKGILTINSDAAVSDKNFEIVVTAVP